MYLSYAAEKNEKLHEALIKLEFYYNENYSDMGFVRKKELLDQIKLLKDILTEKEKGYPSKIR